MNIHRCFPLPSTALMFFLGIAHLALADVVVTNTNSQGPGSLPNAIAVANQSPNSVISFNLPGSGPWTITVSATLTIIAPVTVDGTSQPHYDGAFNRIYVEAVAGVSSVFLLTAHSGTTIKGLGMYNYDANGVTIWKDSSWNFVDDNYIGFKKTPSGILHNSTRAHLCAGIGIQATITRSGEVQFRESTTE